MRDFWEEGRMAYIEGLPLSACPDDLEGDDQVEWEGGWMEAEEEDE